MESLSACLRDFIRRGGRYRNIEPSPVACSVFAALTVFFGFLAVPTHAEETGPEPLHVRIDRCMAEIHPGPEIALCSDGEFLRRIYLDLVGRIPSGQEAREFLADPSAEKRSLVIDQLLASPDHARHMARVFDVMLMERRPDKYVKKEAWESYLLTSFQQNKPLNQLAREILAADGVNENDRGPAKFYLEREAEPNLVTREVGRMFFGMDLQCAQCHDHPAIDDYYQADYYNLFAFVGRSYLFQPDKKKAAVLAEKAEGDAKFKSVFTDEEGQAVPRLPGGVRIDDPVFAKDDAYEVKPDPKKKDVRPIPKYSRRQRLAEQATDGSNLAFNRNLANRLWAHMMGRGLVHPVDQHHSDNPPVQPRLLELLAEELSKSKFDLKSMLRQLASSRTYQRQIDLPQDFATHAQSANQQLQAWNTRLEERKRSVTEAARTIEELESQLAKQNASLPQLIEAEKKAAELLAASKQEAGVADKAMNEAQQSLGKHQTVLQLLSESAAKASKAAEMMKAGKQLDDAVALLQAQRQAFAAKVDQQTKQLAKLKAAQSAAAAKLAEAEKTAAQASQNLIMSRNAIAAIRPSLVNAKERLRFDRTSVSNAENQIERLQVAVDYGQSVQQMEQLDRETRALAAKIETSRAAVAKLTASVDGLTKPWNQARAALAKAVTAASTAKQQRESAREAANLLAASLSKASEAAQVFSSDDQLKTLVSKIDTASSEFSTQAAELDSLVAEKTAAENELNAKVQSLTQLMTQKRDELTSAQQQLVGVQKQHAEKTQQRNLLAEKLHSQRESLAEAWANQFSIAVVQPLSPEQLAWSMMHTTGYVDRQRTSVRAALDKKTPLKPEEKEDQAKLAAREKEVEQQTRAKLQGVVDRFVKLFAAAGGQPQDDFFATVDQALFFRNGGELRSWLSPANGNLTDRLQQMEDAKSIAEEMYLSILTRFPSDQEVADVAEFLASPETEKRKAVSDMAWALLTSAEFRFQH